MQSEKRHELQQPQLILTRCVLSPQCKRLQLLSVPFLPLVYRHPALEPRGAFLLFQSVRNHLIPSAAWAAPDKALVLDPVLLQKRGERRVSGNLISSRKTSV